MAAIGMLLMVIAGLTALLAWVGNFYLFAQYVLRPKRRSRFSRWSGVWGGGWFLWVGGYVLAQSAHDSRSWAMADVGYLCIIAGAACMIYTATRHWQDRVSEKRAVQRSQQISTNDGGTWPPPPAQS